MYIFVNGTFSTYHQFLRDNERNTELKETFRGKNVNDAVIKLQRDLGYIHGDPHSGNIMVDPSTGSFNGLIDWDFATKMTDEERQNISEENLLHDLQAADHCTNRGFRYRRDSVCK